MFTSVIDTSLRWLFNWHCVNISTTQKLAAYAHLYSFASVKSVVHWFQIMRNGKFQMYDDDVQPLMVARGANYRPSGVTSYAPARFPTRNIVTPIVLMYGDCDSLVDIHQMTRELPNHTTSRRLHGYEHLDILWGENVHIDVIPHVVEALRSHCIAPDRISHSPKLLHLSYNWEREPSGYTTPADYIADI